MVRDWFRGVQDVSGRSSYLPPPVRLSSQPDLETECRPDNLESNPPSRQPHKAEVSSADSDIMDSVSRHPSQPVRWESELADFRDETPSVRTFRFAWPEGPFAFLPGQYLVVRIRDVQDPKGDSRTFSISSSPTETDGVCITTRIGPSALKQRLFSIRGRVPFDSRGPFGNFTFDAGRPAVLLGGGIGVTPFRSTIRFAVSFTAWRGARRLPTESAMRVAARSRGAPGRGGRARAGVSHALPEVTRRLV